MRYTIVSVVFCLCCVLSITKIIENPENWGNNVSLGFVFGVAFYILARLSLCLIFAVKKLFYERKNGKQ